MHTIDSDYRGARSHSSGIVGRPGDRPDSSMDAQVISFLSYTHTHRSVICAHTTPVIGASPFKVELGTHWRCDTPVKVVSISGQDREGQISAAEYIT
jgi:hypothetical protein